jgi:hypothetical protein
MLSPLDRELAPAPIDDEPVTQEDVAAIQAGIASLERAAACLWMRIWPDFGLTIEDFRNKMADMPGGGRSDLGVAQRVLFSDEARTDIRAIDRDTALRLLKP